MAKRAASRKAAEEERAAKRQKLDEEVKKTIAELSDVTDMDSVLISMGKSMTILKWSVFSRALTSHFKKGNLTPDFELVHIAVFRHHLCHDFKSRSGYGDEKEDGISGYFTRLFRYWDAKTLAASNAAQQGLPFVLPEVLTLFWHQLAYQAARAMAYVVSDYITKSITELAGSLEVNTGDSPYLLPRALLQRDDTLLLNGQTPDRIPIGNLFPDQSDVVRHPLVQRLRCDKPFQRDITSYIDDHRLVPYIPNPTVNWRDPLASAASVFFFEEVIQPDILPPYDLSVATWFADQRALYPQLKQEMFDLRVHPGVRFNAPMNWVLSFKTEKPDVALKNPLYSLPEMDTDAPFKEFLKMREHLETPLYQLIGALPRTADGSAVDGYFGNCFQSDVLEVHRFSGGTCQTTFTNTLYVLDIDAMGWLRSQAAERDGKLSTLILNTLRGGFYAIGITQFLMFEDNGDVAPDVFLPLFQYFFDIKGQVFSDDPAVLKIMVEMMQNRFPKDPAQQEAQLKDTIAKAQVDVYDSFVLLLNTENVQTRLRSLKDDRGWIYPYAGRGGLLQRNSPPQWTWFRCSFCSGEEEAAHVIDSQKEEAVFACETCFSAAGI